MVKTSLFKKISARLRKESLNAEFAGSFLPAYRAYSFTAEDFIHKKTRQKHIIDVIIFKGNWYIAITLGIGGLGSWYLATAKDLPLMFVNKNGKI